ncbi:unnamed protein product, partial [Prorocentrum cordatum]
MATLLALATAPTLVEASPTAGSASLISEFAVPNAPSGLFYYPDQDLLYVLCGTSTNGDHYLYAYTTDGTLKCTITIPEAVGMSRVDGFFIADSKAYIADSQGPIYAGTSGRLGGSMYEMDWEDPCQCDENDNSVDDFSPSCDLSTASWSPSSITAQADIVASTVSSSEGGGNDAYFRNSGVLVKDGSFFAVNGVHPVTQGDYTSYYQKSLIKASLSGIIDNVPAVEEYWPFTASTLGHDVDMEALTCGDDDCATYIYIGDEYNYIYRLTLGTTDPASAVEYEWDVADLVGGSSIATDKGIESLTYSSKTGYFYAAVPRDFGEWWMGISTSSSVHEPILVHLIWGKAPEAVGRPTTLREPAPLMQEQPGSLRGWCPTARKGTRLLGKYLGLLLDEMSRGELKDVELCKTLSWMVPKATGDNAPAPPMRLATGGCDHQAAVWKCEGDSWMQEPCAGGAVHSDWVRCVAWRPDGSAVIASGGWDMTV